MPSSDTPMSLKKTEETVRKRVNGNPSVKYVVNAQKYGADNLFFSFVVVFSLSSRLNDD